jgi:hypothetical protein
MQQVVKAKYIQDYIIEVTFSNKVKKMVNLKDTIFNDHRPIFKELIDKNQFKNFKVSMHTILWNNGLDLAPEFLYELPSQKIPNSKLA